MNNAIFSPENDTCIYKNYTKSSLKSKTVNKLELQKALDLESSKDVFLLGVSTEITEKEGGKELLEVLPGLLSTGFQVVIRGRGSPEYQKGIQKLIEIYPTQICTIEDSEDSLRKLYAAADGILFLSKNSQEVQKVMHYGVVPISIPEKGLENFNAVAEKGNAFIIEKLHVWSIFETCIRARENFKFPYDWKNLQVACMNNAE